MIDFLADKDRSRLARRNQMLAAYQHRLTYREEMRRLLLQSYALLPSPLTQRPNRGTVLLIRPDHLGDMLLSTPAIRALKMAKPNTRLVAMVGDWSAEVIAPYPEIDLVLTVPFPGFTRRPKESLSSPYLAAWRWGHRLRALRAETAIILRPDHWWGALLAYLAGIPNRIGYDLPDVRPFLTDRYTFTPNHAVIQGAQLVERWTGHLEHDQLSLTYPVSESDREYMQKLLDERGITPQRPIIAIHPGAGTPIKCWEPQHWALVADTLVKRLNAAVVLTGSAGEHGQIAEVMKHMNSHAVSLSGETNVGQLAAVYERALVVLGADSGPLHLAVACGAATVHLFGPADPAEFGPWGDPNRQIVLTSGIACSPCRILDWPGDNPANHPCIRDITPRQVVDAALRAVEQPKASQIR
jgi:heptosyltransferase-2/heptosyltransferase-3